MSEVKPMTEHDQQVRRVAQAFLAWAESDSGSLGRTWVLTREEARYVLGLGEAREQELVDRITRGRKGERELQAEIVERAGRERLLEQVLGAYRSAVLSGEPESESLLALYESTRRSA